MLARRFSSISQSIVEKRPVRARLEEHFFNSTIHNLAILNYDHASRDAPLERLAEMAEWNYSHDSLSKLYTTSVANLPTKPDEVITQNLFTTELQKVGLPIRGRKWRKRLRNPIDYTIIRKEIFDAPPKEFPRRPYAPLPSRLPSLKRITLRIWDESAVTNKYIVLSAIMVLQSITGVRPDPVFAEKGDNTKKIRKGMPIGACVELQGRDMYLFLDKMTQCVLPRIADWTGISPRGDGKGAMSFTLPPQAIGYFPDIEPHFDMFPRLAETTVTFQCNNTSDEQTALLLSAFQIPIKEKEAEDKTETNVVTDKWAALKLAKTREERKAIAAAIAASDKAKKEDESVKPPPSKDLKKKK